jgi:predicted DCC family thiol-disulfide oxidoreductase YuxK
MRAEDRSWHRSYIDLIANGCFTILVLFLVFLWPVMGVSIHRFATWQPDASHSFAIHEHGGVFYLAPVLGKVYADLPWVWCVLLVASILTGWLISKRPWRKV